MGEGVFKVGVWEGLCGEASIGCRSGSVMFGAVDAWSDEGAMFVGIVGRWTDYLGSLLKIICVLHDHAGGVYVLGSHVDVYRCLSGTAGHF